MKSQDKIPTSKVARATQFLKTGAKIGGNYLKYNVKKIIDPSMTRDELHQDNATDVYESLSELNQLINLNTNIFEGNGRYWVTVLPSESLGLYADWLGIGTSGALRRANKLGGKADIDVYQRIYLPPLTNQQKQDFKLSRNEYHLELQLQYFQRFEISTVKIR